MPEEIQVEAPEVLSRKLLDAIVAAPDGHLKNASDSSSQMIRRRLRENGYTRLIIPHKPVTDADLNQLPNTELPVIVEEMEPDSPGAKSISFNDTADTAIGLRDMRWCIRFERKRNSAPAELQRGRFFLSAREGFCVVGADDALIGQIIGVNKALSIFTKGWQNPQDALKRAQESTALKGF